MIVITEKDELRRWRNGGGSGVLAFVPTMGALHEGHLSLVRAARERVGDQGLVAVSIFVNPTQFDRAEDLEKYPSALERDLDLCASEGVDLVFTPEASGVYESDASVSLIERSLSETLCGATRPGHFDGVCTVVLKLYHMMKPDVMVFGKKDFQQLAIIKRMMRDLDVDVEVIGGETVREESGLAMSSRNERLSERARVEAAELYRLLMVQKAALETGLIRVGEERGALEEALEELETPTQIDYLSLVCAESLKDIHEGESGEAILAIAVFFDSIRLIDHVTVTLP